jgi:hypothetical protein
MAVNLFVRSHVRLALLHPTVKARFTRLVNVGFIKSVSPIFNFDLIEKESTLGSELVKEQGTGTENENKKDNKLHLS